MVRDGCGLGFHLAACGCIRNYTACPVVVAPVAPVVVAPHVVAPVAPVVVAPHVVVPHVVAPVICPYGYHHGPYGRCLPY